MAPSLAGLALDTVPASPGFSWLNLGILLVVAAVVYPLFRLLRRRVSESRRERWAREEADWGPVYTPENDPDLRRDEPERPS